MPKRALTPTPIPRTYAELRRAVEVTMIKGQRAIDQAKVRTYWETGWLIKEHGLLFKERANYGAKTIVRLGTDLKVDRTVLYRCVRFVERFPIVAGRPQLAWAHYRVLIPVEDAAQRKALERAAIKNGWTADQLEDRIRPLRLADATFQGSGDSAPPPKTKLLAPPRGNPGFHLIVERGPSTALGSAQLTAGRAGDGLAVDLGFKLYWLLTTDQAKRFAKGDIVHIAGDDSLQRADNATKAELFTYAATLRRVVDGDTLAVALEVSPGIFIEQKLRLRGLDCPEMATPEGKAAKRFVDALVAKTTAVTINTTKPDKYDRYLADVFLDQDGEAVFLNNALLSAGHASTKEAWEFSDWGS